MPELKNTKMKCLTDRLDRFIYQVNHFMFYYEDLVKKYRLHFFNLENKQLEGLKVKRPFWPIWFPFLISFSYGARALIVLMFNEHVDTKEYGLRYFTEMFPNTIRPYIEMTVIFWTSLYALDVLYVLGEDIQEYKMLAVFVMDEKFDSQIKPQNLHFNTICMERFERIRKAVFKLVTLVIWNVILVIALAMAFQCYRENVIHQNVFFFVYWNIHFDSFCIMTCIGMSVS